MPGLVNLHNHTSVGQELLSNMPMEDKMALDWYPSVRALNPEEPYILALRAYGANIRTGITVTNDLYVQMLSSADAAEKIGIRAALACEIVDDYKDDIRIVNTIEDNVKLFEKANGRAKGRIQVMFGLDWVPMSTTEQLKEIPKVAKEYDARIHLHLNESEGEVEYSLAKWGLRPTELLYDFGVLDCNCVAAHCVRLSDREIAILGETNTAISHNPSSNAILGNGIARVPEMIHNHITVGIGNDGQEQDLFRVMEMASIVQRGSKLDPTLTPESDIVRMATVEGGKALRTNAGILEKGKKADIIIIDMSDERFTGIQLGENTNIYNYLVHVVNGQDVITSVIDGDVVMEDRMLTKVDLEEIRRKAKPAFESVLSRINIPVYHYEIQR